ncbi:MAG: hypothetical protein WED07_03000 [Candidatus Freyarchaeum deiterrae]
MNPDSTRKNDGYNKAKKIRRTKSTVGNRRDTAYRAADLISKVLAPQPFAFLVVLILAFASPIGTGPILNSLYCFLLGIIFIVFLPVSPVLVAYALGRVDIWVSSRTRRTPFFIFAILIYLIGSLIFFYGKSTAMYAISLSYVFVTLSVAIINLKWKISVHTAGVSGPSTALVGVFGLVALPVVALIVLVVWSRIKLKAHTTWQSIAGAIVGTLVTLGVYVLFYPLLGPSFL